MEVPTEPAAQPHDRGQVDEEDHAVDRSHDGHRLWEVEGPLGHHGAQQHEPRDRLDDGDQLEACDGQGLVSTGGLGRDAGPASVMGTYSERS